MFLLTTCNVCAAPLPDMHSGCQQSTEAEASSDDLSRAATMLEAVVEATRRRWGADHERTTKAEALLADVREKALVRAQ